MNNTLQLYHIINPVKVNRESDLYIAQPFTFSALQRAQHYAETYLTNCKVKIITRCYDEDQFIIPEFIENRQVLDRSVLNFVDIQPKRKLPLIDDLMRVESLIDNTAQSYIIYSNIDIAPMPFFYESISAYIKEGYDCIAVNRKTISAEYGDPIHLAKAFSDIGNDHEGVDTFVVRQDLFNKFILENISIGLPPIGLSLMANILCFAQKPIWLRRSHLTMHLGDDKNWLNPKMKGYRMHNFKNFRSVLDKLLSTPEVKPVPKSVLEGLLEFAEQTIQSLQHQHKGVSIKPLDLIARNMETDDCLFHEERNNPPQFPIKNKRNNFVTRLRKKVSSNG